MRSRINLLWIPLLIVSFIILWGAQGHPCPQVASAQPTSYLRILTEPPLTIIGNAGLQAVATAGDGTPGLPYLIRDRVINASGTGQNGISIRDTTAYFLLQNCSVNYVGPYNAGILLRNVTHGRVEGCAVTSPYNGILLDSCNSSILTGNTVDSVSFDDGIYLADSHHNIVIGNTAHNGAYRVLLYLSNNNTVVGNTANNNQYGVELASADYNNITANRFSGNTQYGIHLSDADFNNVTGNLLIDNKQCIVEDEYCTGNFISGNECTQSSPYIYLFIGAGAVVAVVAVWTLHHRRSSLPRAVKHLRKTKSPPVIIPSLSDQLAEKDKKTKDHYA